MELNGAFIKRNIKVTWRFASWPNDREDAVMILPNVQEITHKKSGKVKISHDMCPKNTAKPVVYDPSRSWLYRYHDDQYYSYYDMTKTTLLPYDAEVEIID